ncbi:hypothetical protein KGQ72_01455 [Patescibacteria group bacterium]|nr:hypothetical protein [Patescibacteria group bacterium]
MKGKPELDFFLSYITTIENSIGSHLFRNLYFRIDGETVDVLEDGNLSCASYVTGILYLFDLVRERHATVAGMLRDAEESGWYEIKGPRKGALMLWDRESRGEHRHIGFCLGNSAISNDSITHVIARHPLVMPGRAILAYYWNDKLN